MKDFGNNRKAAKRIRLRSSPKVFRNTIGERNNGKRDRMDFIRFSLTEQSRLKGRIRGLASRRKVLLLDSDGTVIKRFRHAGRRQKLNLILESGDYFIKVRSGRRQRLRKYRLKLSADTQPRKESLVPEPDPIVTPTPVPKSDPIVTPPPEPSISYADATNGVIANLDTGRVLLPIFGTQDFPAIMTLGDSNTAGFGSGNDGSYRIQLYERFTQDDLTINFVGSQEDAAGLVPDTDTDNEGHSGFTISNLAGLFLRPFQPGALEENPSDIVLLMAGTNDANRNFSLSVTAVVDQMIADMDELIERVQTESSTTKILLSSLPPLDVFGDDGTRVQRIQEFNSRLPGFVQDQVALGRNVTFVNAGGSLTENDLLADGVHLNAEGLIQLGNAWYEALVQEESLSGISNLTGSEFDDRITGSDGANTLNGGAGDDWLSGTTAVLAGANEQDVLTGGAGSDRFILGDSIRPYYTANRDNDYVRIQDFDASVDVVQLHRTASDYAHEQVGNDRHLRLTGTNELIAIFSNTSNLNLSVRGFNFI